MRMLTGAFMLLCGTQGSVLAAENGADGKGSGGDLTVDVGFDSSRGNYGTRFLSREDSISTTLSYDTDNYGFGLTIPYLSQTGPAGTIAGRVRIRRQLRFVAITPIVCAAGLGDIEGSLTRYLINQPDAGLSFDVKGTIKFATASQSKGLGTGKNDYSLAMELTKAAGSFTAMGTLGYSILGSPGNVVISGIRQNIRLNNVYFAQLDGAYEMANRTKVGATLNMGQATSEGAFEQRDLTLYVDFSASRSTKMRVYGLMGLAHGSPDSGAGISASIAF